MNEEKNGVVHDFSILFGDYFQNHVCPHSCLLPLNEKSCFAELKVPCGGL